jgi:hypothetical protein
MEPGSMVARICSDEAKNTWPTLSSTPSARAAHT